ncbi:MAG: hypothetical protein WDN45_09285 [Caulobacteraceae bacterium]
MAASHNLDPFIAALKRDGTMTLVGAPSEPHPSPSVMGMIFGRKSLAGLADRRHRRDPRRCSTSVASTASPPTSN